MHQHGYAHLDLTVENILLLGDYSIGIFFYYFLGKIRLIDFGVSRSVNELYYPGDFRGKPSYTPPEVSYFFRSR